MRQNLFPRMSRRRVLMGMGALSAAALASGTARAQDSIMDSLQRNRVLRNTNREGNTVDALNAIDTVEPILSYDTAYNLQLAISQYQQIVNNGGWGELSTNVVGLVAGVKRQGVNHLRKRLIIGGDLSADTRGSDMFDEHLDAGLRRFQARHGLQVTGKVDQATFYALNVPANYRLAQLQLNMVRVDGLAGELTDKYVVVNIPAAVIEAVEGGMIHRRHTAVVGRIDRQTPILHSKVHQINFNPYWHVPKSIIQKDLIKYMNEDPNYLTEQRIHIYDGKGNELQPTDIDWSTNDAVNYSFRQDPGADNSMGHVKINFHNPYSVYLHDTPSKSLFGENQRFHSSGCVRVEDVDHLVAWLLTDNGWDLPQVETTFASNERLDVSLEKPVPIHTTYITAWANRQGTVSFREDVYQFDAEGRVEFDNA